MKNKKKILLITTLLILIIATFVYYLLNKNFNTTNANNFDSNFYGGFENNAIKVSNSFPIDYGSYLNNYKSYRYSINQTIPVEITLVSSAGFSNAEDLYQKFYIALSPSGNFIQAYKYNDNDINIDMAIMEPAIGGKSYLLVGGIIKNDKAYYFQIHLVDALNNNITQSSIPDIISFNSSRNPQDILILLKSFINKDIPNDYFHKFILANDDKKITDLPAGTFDLPEYQNRN